ncbi:MAG: ATP-dependent 6-phosphofructokinase [Spirochaeta sp.]|jgi:6-phosphofructokinase|nr:ATP-dependent 6-phosphofructokinase [Spirochaeta sp.]
MAESKTKCIGILTSGGDCPGLNAAIRGVCKAAIGSYGIKVVGFLDGFRGLVENRTVALDDRTVSGILTQGGTILGTARDKPHKMLMGGKKMDMTQAAVDNIAKHNIDCLVCLGGGGTQKNAYHLHTEGGLDVLTLPKTIDNDVAGTDITFGFDTAMQIATDAIDRLHTTATSHHRIIVCEIMGHNSGWLALGAGIAGGADVILIPEIPYDLKSVAAHLDKRRLSGKRFSIIAVAEGAISRQEAKALASGKKDKKDEKSEVVVEQDANGQPYHLVQEPKASQIARQLQQLTGTEARVTSLGHVQRGGSPSPRDRLVSSLLGTAAAHALAKGDYNNMIAIRGNGTELVPLKEVAGKKKTVPEDHSWITSAQLLGTCMGI